MSGNTRKSQQPLGLGTPKGGLEHVCKSLWGLSWRLKNQRMMPGNQESPRIWLLSYKPLQPWTSPCVSLDLSQLTCELCRQLLPAPAEPVALDLTPSLQRKEKVSVTQSCPTLCDPVDCCQPGSSVRGIFQARILEWVAISFFRGSSQPRDRTWVSCMAGRFFYQLNHQGSPVSLSERFQ